MDYVRSIYLDVNAQRNLSIVRAKQGDKVLRELAITLTEDGQTITPSGVAKYQFRCSKPDGNAVVLEGDGTAAPIAVSGAVITVTLSEQCLAVGGHCMCDLAMYDASGDILSTSNFILNVVPMPNIASIVDSTTEWQRLMDAIEAAEDFSSVLSFRVKDGYFQFTADGTTWQTICPTSDFVGAITNEEIDALFV